MIDRDPYISVEQAVELTGFAIRTLHRRIEDGTLAVKPSPEKSGNGSPKSLVRLASLPTDAQYKFWERELTPAGAAPTINLAEYPESSRREALRRWDLVHDVLDRMASRQEGACAIIRQIAAQHGEGRRTIERWVAAYRESGMAGLIPRWGKKKGTFTAIPPALADFITHTLQATPRIVLTDLHRQVKRFCEQSEVAIARIPCVSTLNRFIEQAIPFAAKMAWEGPRTYRARAMPKIHRDYLDLAVGEMWVGDHRLLDLFVRLGDGPKAKVVRPWLTAWMDLRSRTIVGWHLSLVPNSGTIAEALRNGILRYGVPKRLYMDNGKDYTCHYWGGKARHAGRADFDADARGVLSLLKIGVTHAQPYSPWSKAIESWFKSLPAWEKLLPGWCGSDNTDKPERLAGEIGSGRIYTMEQVREKLAQRIEEYHDFAHSGEGMRGATPRSLWVGVVKQIPDARALDVLMMRRKQVDVTHQGIKLKGFRYWADDLFMVQKHPHIEARYSQANLNAIEVFKDGAWLCTAERQGAFSSDLSESEKTQMGKLRKAAKERLRQYNQDVAIVRDEREAERRVVNGRPATVVALARPAPQPEPSGPTVRRITGFEQAVAGIERRAATPSRPAPARATGTRRAAETDADLRELIQTAPRGAGRSTRAAREDERDALLREII